MPPRGQFAQGEAEALGGEIGSAGLAGHEEAAQLHDEFKTLRAGDRVPANHGVAVLEMPRGGTPDEHGDDFVLLDNELAQPVSRFASRPEQVLFIEQTVSDLPVGGGGGGADAERDGAGRRTRGRGRIAFHYNANPAFSGPFV